MSQLPLTYKQQLIEKITAIIKGELPPKRHMICVLWDEENPENEENIYLVDSKKVTFKEWTRIANKAR